jgi:spore coat protein U-like protein
VPPLSFGVYDPLAAHTSSPADASSVISVSCTRSIGAAVSFDFGHNGGTDRSMGGPGPDLLHYQIYRDSARSQIWGVGGDSVRVTSRGVTSPEQLTVFGRIPPRQEVAPGAYTDVLTATVDF